MLVTSKKILEKARKEGYAVGAFNFSNLEMLQAIITAAVEARSPVIIATTESAIQYAGLENLYSLGVIAAKAPIPVALHLDHGKDPATVRECIKIGYTSVMFDGSQLPYKKNLEVTKKLASLSAAHGVSLEAELGAIQGKEDAVNVSAREAFFTDPVQAKDFVERTGADILAISIGTAHGPFKFPGETKLDYPRLKKIRQLVRVPLVLHGASGIPEKILDALHTHCSDLGDCSRVASAHGVSDAAIRKAIRAGISKINIDSDLRIAFLEGFRSGILALPQEYDPRVFLTLARQEVRTVVRQKMRLFGSAGKAK